MKTATLTAKVNRWLHEHLAIKAPAKLLGGLALGALVMTATALPLGTAYADEPARPLSSEQGACYPLYPELGPCASEFGAVTPTIADRNDRGLFDEVLPEDLKQGEVSSPVSGVQFEYWPEVGLDSYTYHRFMVEQGKAGKGLSTAKVYVEIDDGEAMVIYGYSASIFYALNEGKVARPSVREHSQCYPELGPCPSESIAVTPTSADRNDRGLFDEVLPEDLK